MQNKELIIILIIAAAGIVGTGIGGVIGSFLKSKTDRGIRLTMSLSIGIMLGLVLFSILPESVELSGVTETIISIVVGALVAFVFITIIEKIGFDDELSHGSVSYSRSGFMFVAAISLHNLPEGIALGVGAHHNIVLGITWAVLITLHNLPMGISISIPFIESGKSKKFSIVITALVGSTLLVGGVIGLLLGDISESFRAYTLSVSAGILLFVIIKEIVPMIKSKGIDIKCFFIIILGLVLSFLITSLGHH